MKYDQYLHWSSIALILTGFYSIVATGSYLLSVGLGITITLLYGFVRDPVVNKIPIPRWIWNICAIVLFLYLTYDTFFGELDLVGNGIVLVIYLQIVKILSPKTNRDWIQIYTLSFLQLLASTVLSSDITFLVPFLMYIVVATWTLILFSIKVQQEEAIQSNQQAYKIQNLLNSTNIISRKFLFITSILSLSIISITMIIFFIFPRVSMGQFLRRVTNREHISGFSEEVELGTIGTIKTNNAIVLRVELSKETLEKLDTEYLYWRGTATDHFDGKKWSQTAPERRRIQIDPESSFLNTHRSNFPGGQIISYRVFLEALNTPILFGSDRLYRVIWDKPLLEKLFRRTFILEKNEEYETYHFVSSQNFASDLTYQAESYIGEPLISTLNLEEKYSSPIRSRYLQLPPLDPQVKKLITNIPIPKLKTFHRAKAIQQYIEQHYIYTLDVGDVGVKDPLRFFFVEKKKGHCEYFSTALIIALRVHGIPCRQVVGFRGGEFNPYGGYLAVRQSDAHSWAEVYFEKAGWVRFDPSPLDSTVRTPHKSFQKLFQFFDYLRLRWNKYIIEYDLSLQASIAEKIGRHVMKIAFQNRKNSQFDEQQKTETSFLKRPIKAQHIMTLLLFCIFLFLSWKWWKNRFNKTQAKTRYSSVLRILKSHGHQKLPSQTPREFAQKVENNKGSLPTLRYLTASYYDERFGDISIVDEQWKKELKNLRKELSDKK